MPNIQNGSRLGEWKSRFGTAEIQAREKIGSGYSDPLEAHKAIVQSGKQGAIVLEGYATFAAYAIEDGAALDDLNLGETVEGKASAVVDFVGSDGASLERGIYVEPPTGKDNGKNVHFMRALDRPNQNVVRQFLDNAILGAPNRLLQTDEKALLRAKGYTVVVDNTATSREIVQALYDPRTSGLVFLGHGGGGKLSTAGNSVFNPKWLGPQNIDPSKVSPNLRMAYFQSCSVGKQEAAWQKVLGPQTEIFSWSRYATNLDLFLANSGSNLYTPKAAGLLNPYEWMGETLSQAINRNLD